MGWEFGNKGIEGNITKPLKDGEPCDHPGCLNHITHPCEGCGRVGGLFNEESLMELKRRKMDRLNNDDDAGPWDGKRYEIMGLENRSQYILIDDEGLVITFPDNQLKNKNYQATATALTRVISVCLRAEINMDIIKKQLLESSYQLGDTPNILLRAIERFENENKGQKPGNKKDSQ